MDPDANLAEQRRIVVRIISDNYHPHEVIRLAELVEALDNWIVSGGFLPAAWKGIKR